MLDQVLHIVAQGGIHTRSELAQRLDVREELLQQMIDELVHIGYLKPVVGDCNDRCVGCPFAANCAIGGAGRIWALTDKGLRASDLPYGGSQDYQPPSSGYCPLPRRPLQH